MSGDILITGARQHNLKNINVRIPRDSLTVITGLSGSGKSSLAFDTLYAEGQRRYVESLSAYARQFLDQLQKPDVEHIEGLSPAIAIVRFSRNQGRHRKPLAVDWRCADLPVATELLLRIHAPAPEPASCVPPDPGLCYCNFWQSHPAILRGRYRQAEFASDGKKPSA